MLGRQPMNHAFDLAAFGFFAQSFVVDGAFQLNHVARFIGDHFFALNHIAVAQAHFAAHGQALPFWWRIEREIVLFDVDVACNRNVALAHFFVVRVKRCAAALCERLIVIDQFNFQWVQHRHHARRRIFQLFAYRAFQHAHVNHVFRFGNAHAFGEQAQTFWCVTTAAHA